VAIEQRLQLRLELLRRRGQQLERGAIRIVRELVLRRELRRLCELIELERIVEIDLLVIELFDRLIEQNFSVDDVALPVPHFGERRAHRAIVGLVFEQRLEILARVGDAAGHAAQIVEQHPRLDALRIFALRDRSERAFGCGVVAGRELGAREQDACSFLIFATDLRQLGDRCLVFTRRQLVAPGGEIRGRGSAQSANEDQRQCGAHAPRICATSPPLSNQPEYLC
jgi:hypothetical protein